MNFFKEKSFWVVIIIALGLAVIIYLLQNKKSSNTPSLNEVAGSGCQSSSGLDKFGNPCPSKGTGCPNIRDTDFYGNPCPPDCFNGCRSSQPGYDCEGNFSANC